MSAQNDNSYEIKAGLGEVESFDVVGISTRTSNKDGKATDDINELWERFFASQVGQAVSDKVDDVIYAVYSDYEGDHEAPYRVTIGYRTQCSENESESGLETQIRNGADSLHKVKVEPGRYGIMSAAGTQPKALIETWEAIWSSDLDRAFTTDFEVYGPRFFEEGVNEVLIHVGLKEEDN